MLKVNTCLSANSLTSSFKPSTLNQGLSNRKPWWDREAGAALTHTSVKGPNRRTITTWAVPSRVSTATNRPSAYRNHFLRRRRHRRRTWRARRDALMRCRPTKNLSQQALTTRPRTSKHSISSSNKRHWKRRQNKPLYFILFVLKCKYFKRKCSLLLFVDWIIIL